MDAAIIELATLLRTEESVIRQLRYEQNLRPVFKRVDTCAAEFGSDTAYLYSTYEEECEADPTDADKIMILGGGPNRIGQGIEFDYCCVHAAFALKEAGFETIMVNCNPETVSTPIFRNTARTTALSSAPSKISIRWGYIPVTQSPWHRHRR